jgi:hypothetical protein
MKSGPTPSRNAGRALRSARPGAAELYYNDPDDGWSDLELRERIDSDSFSNVSFEDPSC